MRISVFGLGYVGTVCAACLADRGHTVIGIDKAKAKVDLIRSGRSPVVEREIDKIVKRNVENGSLTAAADVSKAVRDTDMSTRSVQNRPAMKLWSAPRCCRARPAASSWPA